MLGRRRGNAVDAVANLSETGLAARGGFICAEMRDVQGPPFRRFVIPLCVRRYLAYGLSLRDLKEMLAERGINVDHSTIHRGVVHFSPLLLERFNERKRASDSLGDTVGFSFNEKHDLPAAKRFLRKALKRHGRPTRIVIDGSQTNREAITA